MADPLDAPKPEKPSPVGVDIPAELKRPPSHNRRVAVLRSEHGELISQGVTRGRNASPPPFSPSSDERPPRFRGASTATREPVRGTAKQACQRGYGVLRPCLNTAQLVFGRLIIAGELAGLSGIFVVRFGVAPNVRLLRLGAQSAC